MTEAQQAEYPLLITAVGIPLVFCPWTTDMHLLPKMLFASVMITAAALCLLWQVLARQREIRFASIVDGPLAALVLAMLLSTATAVDVSASWTGEYGNYTFGLLSIAMGLAAYYLSISLNDKEFPGRLAFWMTAGSIPVSAYALIQWVGLDPVATTAQLVRQTQLHRPMSTLGGPVILGVYLMTVLPMALSVILQKKKNLKTIGIISFVLGLVALYATQTRSAWLGLLFAVGIFLFASGKWNRYWTAVAVFAVILCSFGIWRIHQKKARDDQGRFEIWHSALQIFEDYPLLGTGPDNFSQMFDRYRQGYIEVVHNSELISMTAHNDWLQVMATLGLIGTLAYLWFHVRLFQEFLRRALRRVPLTEAAIMGSLVGIFIQIKMDTAYWQEFILAAILAGCVLKGRSRFSGRLGNYGILLLVSTCIVMSLACARMAWADRQDYLGQRARWEGRPRDAMIYFEHAMEMNPYATLYRNHSVNLLWDVASDAVDVENCKKDLLLATGIAYDGIRRRPQNYLSYRLLGDTEIKRYELCHEGRLVNAQQALDEAYRLNPTLIWIRDDRSHLEELMRKRRK